MRPAALSSPPHTLLRWRCDKRGTKVCVRGLQLSQTLETGSCRRVRACVCVYVRARACTFPFSSSCAAFSASASRKTFSCTFFLLLGEQVTAKRLCAAPWRVSSSCGQVLMWGRTAAAVNLSYSPFLLSFFLSFFPSFLHSLVLAFFPSLVSLVVQLKLRQGGSRRDLVKSGGGQCDVSRRQAVRCVCRARYLYHWISFNAAVQCAG